MVRGGTGLVGRAVAQFEAARRAGRDHHAHCVSLQSHRPATNGTKTIAQMRSLIPQPLRDKAVITRTELTEDEELSRLRAELRELREHNELLEFRLLEKQSAGSDNVSDSGVSEDPLDRDHMERVLSLVHHHQAGASHSPSPPRSVLHHHGSEPSPQLLSPLSMHESGIFDTILIETENRGTQTEEEDDAGLPELKREVQKLLRFRETVCEAELSSLLRPTETTEMRSRQLPCSQCGPLAQHVAQHEARIKELTARCEALVAENRRLDEERCELEEAENDARHISQRLESRVAALHEERALLREELRRGAAERASISRQARRWETLASQLEERNFELEEADVETKHKLTSLEETLPGLLTFTALMAKVSQSTASIRKRRMNIPALPAPKQSASTQTDGEESEVSELRARVLAYSETLQLADQLWADTERQYQSRLQGAETTLTRLRDRVVTLEDQVTRVRATCCTPETLRSLEKRNEALQRSERRLQQHVHELEASEMTLRDELRRAVASAQMRERRLSQEAARAREEADEARATAAELQRARDELGAQLTVNRKRCDSLRKEVEEKHKAAIETQAALSQEESRGRVQRRRAATLLAEAECTNSELREEVDTLETSVRCLRGQLEAQRQASERAILRLNLTLSTRDRELSEARRELEAAGAHEAGLVALAQRAALAAHQLQGCSHCGVLVQPEVREVASQLRALADIVSGEAQQRRHSQSCGDSEPEEEEIPPPIPPSRRHSPTGSRVRAAQRALLRATNSNKPAAMIPPCPPPRPTELVAR